MDKEITAAPVARVTRVGIGRLYNLGNYEHIRYDLTIDIPDGVDVLDGVSKLRQILRALKPLRAEGYAEKKARQIIAMSLDVAVQAVADRRVSEEDIIAAPVIVERLETRKAKREAALLLFNDLGGASVYTDHKEQWDDNYDDEY